MDRFGLTGHGTPGVEVSVKVTPGFDLVDQFHASDFHKPMPVGRAQAGGFGIEYNLAHVSNLSALSAPKTSDESTNFGTRLLPMNARIYHMICLRALHWVGNL